MVIQRFLPCALLFALGGCAEPREKFQPVAGVVRLDGKLLTFGAVSFRPDGTRGNASMHIPTGSIDVNGHYELETIKRKGAPPGWYKVLVFVDGNALPSGYVPHPLPPKWVTDVKYTDEQTTDLFVEVVENPAPGRYDLNVSP